MSPGCAECGRSRRTTMARAKDSPRLARSAARSSNSEPTRFVLAELSSKPLVVGRHVDVSERRRGPGEGKCLAPVPLHHLLATAFALHRLKLAEERSVVEHRRRIDPSVVRNHQRSGALSIAVDERG